MQQGLETLKKILALECQRGFTDKAVVGGLDAFLDKWRRDSPDEFSLPNSYEGLELSERKRWIEATLAKLSGSPTPPPERPPSKARAKTPAVKAKSTQPKPAPKEESPQLGSPITVLKGVQDATAKRFVKLGVETVRDLIYHFPNRHLDFRITSPIANLVPGEDQTTTGFIWEASLVRLGPRAQGTEVIIGDDTGNIKAVWFNNTWLARSLKPNQRIAVGGKVKVFRGRKVFENPEHEIISENNRTHTGRMVPIYPLTDGLYQRSVRSLVRRALDLSLNKVSEVLHEDLIRRRDLLGIREAITLAHYPDDEESKERARTRLAFDELFLIQLRVLAKKRDWQLGQEARPIPIDSALTQSFVDSLPFPLTNAQSSALDEVTGDMQGSRPMARLLQGDVGSGKTVVATGALLQAVASGAQGAIMVPTEILAEQHFRTICGLLGKEHGLGWGNEVVQSFDSFLDRPIRVGLLMGDIRQGAKREVHRMIEEGHIDIVVGTQALIQKDVEFRDLALIVVDEQHRFGVMQRAALRQKGASPHLLVMTATPIPRTLALTLYGDLDLTILDEMPPGRLPIETKWVKPRQRNLAYDFVRQQVQKGRQAFVICPLVEESEALQTRAATKEYEWLSEDVFRELRLGLLHGRMNPADKDEVMDSFRQGELDILVSTAVVEVGIDVPNASVMMIEGAERFGLSQLHQFRGRVGRGPDQSYCLLLSDQPSEEAQGRLDLMTRTLDGFVLAEEDLRLRGPGEFFGTRQSGLPDLRMARLSDTALLEMARLEAEQAMGRDPYLELPEHKTLAAELERLGPTWAIGGTEA